MAPVRVVVADDHTRYRHAVRRVLAGDDGITVVGEASDGNEAVELCRRLRPDVVLLDVRMPGAGGVDACVRIRRAAPSVRVLVLTASDDERDLFAAVRAGALGYLLKGVAGQELVAAVRQVHEGRGVIAPTLASPLLRELRRLHEGLASDKQPDGVAPRLSDRELQVLRLLARGMPNRHIAARLVVSEHTVKKHVHSILEKLQVESRTEAALYAHRERLVGNEG